MSDCQAACNLDGVRSAVDEELAIGLTTRKEAFEFGDGIVVVHDGRNEAVAISFLA